MPARISCRRSRALRSPLLACVIAASPAPLLAQSLAPDLYIRASRIGSGVAGASTSVITAQDIERTPAATLQDLLALEPGLQTQSFYGGVSGANATVDVRGFGAAAASNTLVLVNGRRTNEIDLQSVDYATIPLDSIERIEIVRGGSGAVLYGDGAVGGVINIVTKQRAAAPQSVRADVGAGSYGQAQASLSAQANTGSQNVSLFVTGVRSDGYRANNAFTQGSGVFNYNRPTPWGSLYVGLTADTQTLGLPGARVVDPGAAGGPINELRSDRRGATTPLDYADKQGVSALGGVTVNIADGLELIVDAGLRQKEQQAGFFYDGYPYSYIVASLTTASFTPRLRVDGQLFGAPWKTIAGVDVYDTRYGSPRSQFEDADPIHVYRLGQTSLAAYAMNTVAPNSNLTMSFGARLQRTAFSARDTLDKGAPGYWSGDTQGVPLDKGETNSAWHLGFEHRLAPGLVAFGRAAQSFRVPNVDERIGMPPTDLDTWERPPTTFDLKTQTSRDVEAGLRARYGVLDMRVSAYQMALTNEIHYSPATFSNVNLDPTRRSGVEAQLGAQITDAVRLRAGAAYTRAVFREGAFAGNDVPLVSRETANIGVSWAILDRGLMLDATARYVGPRFMDNDQGNEKAKTPGFGVVDIKLGGEANQLRWSAALYNAFDRKYFDYGVVSTSSFTPERFNAYPLPGRTFLLKVGASF